MNVSLTPWEQIQDERERARQVFTSVGDDGVDMSFQNAYTESEGEIQARISHLVRNSIPDELSKKSPSKKVGELTSIVSYLAMNALLGEQKNTIKSYDEGIVAHAMLVATRHDDNLYGSLPEINNPITQILTRHGITNPTQFLEEHYMEQREKFDRIMNARFEALRHL